MTALTCELEYENAPYPSCHWNFPFTNLWSLINFEDIDFISLIKTETEFSGCNAIKICI